MNRALASALVLASLAAPAAAHATEMGLPTAGFHTVPFVVRVGIAGDSTMYQFQDATDPTKTYNAAFATGGAVAAVGILKRVEVNGGIGAAGFNSYQNTFGAPDGTYKFYTAGLRVTVWKSEELPVQVGGGAQLAWWNHDNLISSGERTLVVGASWRPIEGNVVFGGGEYFTVGSGAAVDAKIETTPVKLVASGGALYGGYRLRLGIFVLQAEGRLEMPDPSRHQIGAMAGLEI